MPINSPEAVLEPCSHGSEDIVLAVADDPQQNVAASAGENIENDMQTGDLAGVTDYARINQSTDTVPIQLPSTFTGLFSFDVGKYVNQAQLTEAAPQATELILDDVFAVLTDILRWLRDLIGVLVNDSRPIRACFNDVMNQLPADLVSVLMPNFWSFISLAIIRSSNKWPIVQADQVAMQTEKK
ncbi:hypothetical protein ABZP36_008038 [Zizania latifolia]